MHAVGPSGGSVVIAVAVSASSIWRWFTDKAHWEGANGITHRLYQHVTISAISLLIAVAVALPVGIALGHLRRGGLLAQNLANVGRAVPSLAILIVAVPFVGIGARPAEIALIALAIPPILTNAYVGMTTVDEDVRDAARGMGMTGTQSLLHAELPLALPLIIAGIRTATFQVIATATLAAIVASGGLGQFITEGIELRDNVELVCGSLLVVGLCVFVELCIAGVQRIVIAAPLRHTDPTNQREELTHAIAP